MDFESSQIRWDQDDDGDIDVDDILAAFDTDGDGQIGSNELQKLAEQLSSQVDYNNMLIEHLKSMEEEQVRIQEDMKEKQNALKQAIAVGDAARSEANDLRRKLAIF
jgi:Ca2+-binding EF-hand superfamily protein